MNARKIFLGVLAITGLVLTILPSILVFNDIITLERHKMFMLIGMLAWFVAAPFVMNQKQEAEA